MNAWLVVAITVAILTAWAAIVHLIGRYTAHATTPPPVAAVPDHPARAARRRGQTDYAQLIVWELEAHGHPVTLIDVLDCLASTRLALKDDIDGAAVDAYYVTVLGGDAS